MAARRVVEGKCQICGNVGPLNYEHVPPRAAFNDGRVVEPDTDRILKSDSIEYLDNRRGRVNQRGVGGYTLCYSCNNRTGLLYVPAYVEFANDLYGICHGVPVFKSGMIQITTKPLNVLKQILVMFCSCNGPRFAEVHEQLIRFLLNPESRDYPRNFHLSIALFNPEHSALVRSSGIVSQMDLDTKQVSVFSEISFPPLVIVLNLSERQPDRRLTNIDWFSNYNYNEVKTIPLILHSLPVSTPIGGTYLTELQLRELYAES